MKAVATYLLLVSFFSPTIIEIDQPKVNSIIASPYDGLAVPLSSPYEFPDLKGLELVELGVHKYDSLNMSRKHFWPWVFLNWIVGGSPHRVSHNAAPKIMKERFGKIRGLDIYDETGSLSGFYKAFEIALLIAKRKKVPGIVLDPELYNDYRMCKISNLAEELSRPASDVIVQLRKVGATLAGIAEKTYPGALIWCLFDGTDPGVYGKTERHLPTAAYITIGLLDKIKEEGMAIKVISGGETEIGYCHESADDLMRKASIRNGFMKPYLERYSPNLKLAGTVALWNESKNRRGWLAEGKCKNAEFENVSGFAPILETLFALYPFNWIYAASAAGYDPFDLEKSRPYNNTIRLVLDKKSVP